MHDPKYLLSVIAIILAVVSYWPGAPTLGVSVILLGIVNIL